ncbi:MAG: response regulator transcription factor [Planctomycetota bacterium]
MKAIGPGGSLESASWGLGTPEPTRSELDSGTPSGSATLTRREREVATLLVEDCSRAEVAERLGISTNTVISHTRNIYRKLGVRSRIGLQRRLA